MTDQPTRKIVQEVRIDATPEQVFAAWAEPDQIARWFPDSAEGVAAAGQSVTWHFDGFGSHPMPVVEVVPGERIVYGGELPGRPPWALEIHIEQAGGATLLRLVNSGFLDGASWDEEYEGVDSGWAGALATLKWWLEHYARRRRTHFLVMRAAQVELDAVVPRFMTAGGLSSWLVRSAALAGAELERGAAVRLDLGELGELAGHVLARTRREALLSWPQRAAVLGLKAFVKPTGERVVAVDISTWGDAGQRAALEPYLGRALDQLVRLRAATA